METLGNLWYVWLGGTVVCYGYALYNQVGRMRRMSSNMLSFDIEGAQKSFLSGIGSAAAAGFLGSIFGVLFVIGILMNIFG